MPVQKLFVPREEYVDMYWNKGMILKQISEYFNTPKGTIVSQFKRYNISRRTNSEAHIGQVAWNKGKTKYDDERVMRYTIKKAETFKRLYKEGKIIHPRGMLGKENKWGKQTEESKKKLSDIKKKLYVEGKIKIWNEGKTKATDPLLADVSKKISETRKRLYKEGKLDIKWENKLPAIPWNKGKSWPDHAGEKHWNWKGGISFEPYCPKFNDSFKESIREKFNRICFLCPTTEKENGQKLSVHHVNYRKDCLCEDITCEFVPLCKSCHSKTTNNHEYWKKEIMNKLEILL